MWKSPNLWTWVSPLGVHCKRYNEIACQRYWSILRWTNSSEGELDKAVSTERSALSFTTAVRTPNTWIILPVALRLEAALCSMLWFCSNLYEMAPSVTKTTYTKIKSIFHTQKQCDFFHEKSKISTNILEAHCSWRLPVGGIMICNMSYTCFNAWGSRAQYQWRSVAKPSMLRVELKMNIVDCRYQIRQVIVLFHALNAKAHKVHCFRSIYCRIIQYNVRRLGKLHHSNPIARFISYMYLSSSWNRSIGSWDVYINFKSKLTLIRTAINQFDFLGITKGFLINEPVSDSPCVIVYVLNFAYQILHELLRLSWVEIHEYESQTFRLNA